MNKGSLTEDDVYRLFHRYGASTILLLLQEVSQYAGVKIDWKSLAKKTNTGISNAREYQMLWRHLAYNEKLLPKVESGQEPLDDDSDLDYEFEPSANICSKSLAEAAATVKVLMSNSCSIESVPANRSSAEASAASLNGHASRVPLESLQRFDRKPPLPKVDSSEALDEINSKCRNFPPRRKRKLWTPEEDSELIASVQKHGKGNWANIVKNEFMHARTASQLSKRWGTIIKRQSTVVQNIKVVKQTGAALSEAQLATRQAVSMALKMPLIGNLEAAGSSNPSTAASENLGQLEAQARKATPQSPNHMPLQKKMGPSLGYSIQEAAVAAGARIATPSTAVSLLKAAQSKNAVHVKQGGSLPSIGSRPSNVHFIRAGSGVVPTISRPGNVAAIARQTPPGQPPVSSGLSASLKSMSRMENSKMTSSTLEHSCTPTVAAKASAVESSDKISAKANAVESSDRMPPITTNEKADERNESVTCKIGKEIRSNELLKTVKNLSGKLDTGKESAMNDMNESARNELSKTVKNISSKLDRGKESAVNDSARNVLSRGVDEARSICKNIYQIKDEKQKTCSKAEICPKTEVLVEDPKHGGNVEVASDATRETKPISGCISGHVSIRY